MDRLFRTVCHRDGTVTYWDVYLQGFRRDRAVDITDVILSTLGAGDRRRILRLKDRWMNVL
mgnify:CR=1 FL=1